MKTTAKSMMLLALCIGLGGCYGASGSAYVGVYGPPVYGPGPWGPRAGPYGPYGGYPPGGVWVGVPVCCEDEQQEEQQEQPDAPGDDESQTEGAEAPAAHGGGAGGGSPESPDGTVDPSDLEPTR
jgi:hypothetical protein